MCSQTSDALRVADQRAVHADYFMTRMSEPIVKMRAGKFCAANQQSLWNNLVLLGGDGHFTSRRFQPARVPEQPGS